MIIWITGLFVTYPIDFYSDFVWIIYLSVAVVCVFTDFISDFVSKRIKTNWIKKGVWLIRVLLLVLIFFLIRSKFIPMVKDLPNALRGNYERTSGVAKEVQTIYMRGSKQNFVVNGIHFEVSNHIFYGLEDGKSCTVLYLQNSKYMMGMEMDSVE